jgi:hypothetical protein
MACRKQLKPLYAFNQQLLALRRSALSFQHTQQWSRSFFNTVTVGQVKIEDLVNPDWLLLPLPLVPPLLLQPLPQLIDVVGVGADAACGCWAQLAAEGFGCQHLGTAAAPAADDAP